MIELRQAQDKGYALNLMKENMGGYYEELNIDWKPELFEASWPELENFEILKDGRRVGVMRLSQDEEALYIRDLQIKQEWQNLSIGSEATKLAFKIAHDRKLKKLRLRVFQINPAKLLYQRLGFEVTGKSGYVLSMQANVS